MDWGAIVTAGCAAGSAVGAIAWYLYRRLQGQVDRHGELHSKETADLRAELSAHRLHVAEHYVTDTVLTKALDSLNDTIRAVFKKLDRIDEKLDRKADKP
ncbi:hypothetical protein BUE93_21050 [Chromobacterium amazonense]|uniref:Uncharacterized protein n=1 Tax=Chromobacterium amazonense TaxID=1382803 RepID=A0A2S9WYY5_9NEIS|nr:hypothetical protein [Chromobacterium amazonense]PRP68678.1 hypothetical protein BUE93_21050 [Chromobacterium amazonense]